MNHDQKYQCSVCGGLNTDEHFQNRYESGIRCTACGHRFITSSVRDTGSGVYWGNQNWIKRF